jgi:hypothetical protein
MSPDVIWKFILNKHNGRQEVQMPRGAMPLSAGQDPDGSLAVWALVDPRAESVSREFEVLFTGERVRQPRATRAPVFLGTVIADGLVYHVYDHGEVAA